jgi:DNA primase
MSNDFDNTKPYILQVIEHQTGLKSKKIGNQYNLNPCPFCKHNDCFFVKSDDNGHFFKCQSCGEGGTVHDFIQKQASLTLSEGLKLISDITGYQLQNTPNSTPKHKSNNIHDVCAKYYNQVYLKDKSKQQYQLQVRGHTPETLEKRMIGVTDRRLHIYLENEGFSESEMLASGLVKNKDGRLVDVFNFSGMFVNPQVDINGNVGHFTIKDPRGLPKNEAYNNQLKSEFKNAEIVFDNMPAFKQDHIYIVEGENDLNSLMDIGINNVIGTNGQISEKQLYYIQEWIKSERQKAITLIFDNNDAGRGYTEKVIASVQSKCFVDLLKSELWQQNLILKIITFDKYDDIDDYLVKQGGTDKQKKRKLFDRLQSKATRYMMRLRDQIKLYKNEIEDRNKNAEPGNRVKPNNIYIGKLCAEYFKNTAFYFVESENDYICNIFYEDSIYRISDNRPFNALMNRIAGLNASQNGFKVIRQEIEDEAYNTGKSVVIPGWITREVATSTIYFNLCNERKELLRISPNEIEIIKNGSNQAGILLREAPKMSGITYHDDVTIEDTFKDLKELIFDSLACSETNKYYIICFLINSFFVNFIEAKGLLKFSGNAGSGKTTAARLITSLLFKEGMISTGTTASDYTEAATSPVLVMDNLERGDLNHAKLAFLLFVATGVVRRKRDKNSQTGNVYEKVNTQIIWTAIEPPEKEELIQRTIDIRFNKSNWKSGFSETDSIEDIQSKRDRILSGIFKLIAYKILPDFKQRRKKARIWIEKNHKDHAKERLNELISTLSIILKEVCNYIPYSNHAEGKKDHMVILEQWITEQNTIAKNVSKNTNEIVRFLNFLLDGYLYHQTDFENEFQNINVTPVKTMYDNEYESISFEYTTHDLLNFFEKEAKERGVKCSFVTSEGLSARIRNSIDIIKAENWNYESKIKDDKVKKNARGHRIYRLTKKFEASGF